MTTNDEGLVEFPPREIFELLALDTYQGMTDAEIDSVIAWKLDMQEKELRAEFQNDTIVNASNAMVEACNAGVNAALDTLKSLRDRNFGLVEVSFDE